MDGEALALAIEVAAPAMAIDREFLPARLALRLYCGAQAAALEARLVQLIHDAGQAAMAERDRGFRVAGGVR